MKEKLKKCIDVTYDVTTKILRSLISYIIVGLFALFFYVIGTIVGADRCYARTIYYGSEVETVTVAYGGPTIFRFNEEVKTISQAAKFKIAPDDSKDPSYMVLSVTPRFTRGKSKVSFILANGAVVNMNLIVVSKALPEKTDSFYDFEPKERLIDNSSNQKGKNVSELELMKAMIRWDSVVGYKARSLVRTVKTGVSGLSAKLVRIYTGPKYNGYVFKIRNYNRKKYAIDVKSLTLGTPNVALLSQVDKKILKGSKSKENVTFLRIVAKPTSVYYNIALPIAPITKK